MQCVLMRITIKQRMMYLCISEKSSTFVRSFGETNTPKIYRNTGSPSARQADGDEKGIGCKSRTVPLL